MIKAKDGISLFLYSVFNLALILLFLLNLPILREPHGLLVTDQLSDFSNTQFIQTVFWGSVVLCALSGVIMLEWHPALTPGMAANLWATALFLMWVDSLFALCIQFQSFHYLMVLCMGIFFLYLFFFTLNYFGHPEKVTESVKGAQLTHRWFHITLGIWMAFYFILSWLLIANSYWCPQFQLPLALGFWGFCFLHYLLWMFLKKSDGEDIGRFSRTGRFVFTLWFLALLSAGLGQRWFH